jgi:antirestriction protein ArdC
VKKMFSTRTKEKQKAKTMNALISIPVVETSGIIDEPPMDYREQIIAALIGGSLKTVQVPKDEPSEEKAESIIRKMPNAPPIGFGGRLRKFRGRYDIENDMIWINAKMESRRLRYPTIFHELAHATSHPTRLDRDCSITKHLRAPVEILPVIGEAREHVVVSHEEYCREEILAELSALYLCLESGLFWSHQKDGVGYIKDILEDRNAKTSGTPAAVLRPLHAEAIAIVDFILGVGSRSRVAA